MPPSAALSVLKKSQEKEAAAATTEAQAGEQLEQAPAADLEEGEQQGVFGFDGKPLGNAYADGDEITTNGIITNTIFANNAGFNIIEISVPRHSGTVVVAGPSVLENRLKLGEHVQVEGVWRTNSKYGRQIKAYGIAAVPQISADSIKQWIRHGNVPKVGIKTAEKLVKHFGDDLVSVMDSPEALITAGISEIAATSIANAWSDTSSEPKNAIMLWLFGLGIGVKTAHKILKEYGIEARQRIEADPWSMAREITGIGFIKADEIALATGADLNSTSRIHAALRYVVENAADQGHCGLVAHNLVKRSLSLLSFSTDQKDRVADVLKEMIRNGELRYVAGVPPIVMPRGLFDRETFVAQRLAELAAENRNSDRTMTLEAAETLYKHVMRDAPPEFKPDPSQEKAMITAIQSKNMIITGGPGTGKSTIIRYLLEALALKARNAGEDMPVVALLAPTGKASQRQTEITRGTPALAFASTVHSFLRAGTSKPDIWSPYVAPGPDDDIRDPDLMVFDEGSMLDLYLTASILNQIDFERTQVIFEGDVNQLPSVGPGKILHDMINSGALPVVALNQVHRQGPESAVAQAAALISQGKMPPKEMENDFYRVIECGSDDVEKTVLKLLTEDFPEMGYTSQVHVQTMAPQYAGSAGIDVLNTSIRNCLNPRTIRTHKLRFGEMEFCPGDKVIQKKNDKEKGVVNGDIGFVESLTISKDENDNPNGNNYDTAIVRFSDDRRVRFEGSQVKTLRPANVISIHGFQGSEIPVSVTVIDRQATHMLKRNLVFTALTRGKVRSYIVGQRDTIERAIQRTDDLKRHSRLSEKTQHFMRNIAELVDSDTADQTPANKQP